MKNKKQLAISAPIGAGCRAASISVMLLFLIMAASQVFAQPFAGDFRSVVATGNWNTPGSWERYNGTIWEASGVGANNPGQTPTATSSVFIQIGHSITLTQNEACNNLNLNNTAAQNRLALGTFTLSLNGKLRAYSAAVGTIPGTNGVPSATNNWITSTTGKIMAVGSTRSLTASGEWSGANLGAASPNGFDLEINLTAGQTATCITDIRVRNITVTSGILTMSGATNIFVDQGAANLGTFTIASGATVNMGTGTIQRTATQSATNHFATFTSNGSLNFTGVTTANVLAATTTTLNGTVGYTAAGNQTFVVRGATNTAAANPATYNNVLISGSGIKTLGLTTTINGDLTISAGTLADAAAAQLIGPGVASGKTLDMSAAVATAITMVNTSTDPFPAFQNYNLHSTLSTVAYNANATQNIRGGLSYGNLTLANGTLVKSPAADFTVKGTLTIGTGANNLGGVNRVVTVNGNIVNTGGYTGTGTSKILLTGASSVHLLTGTGAYTNLELDDAFGANANASFTINGVLSLTSGTFAIGAGFATTLTGTINPLGSGLLGGSTTSDLLIGGVGDLGRALVFNQTSTYPNLRTVTITRGTSGIVNLGSNVTIHGTLTLNAAGLNFYIGSNQLTFNGQVTPVTLTAGTFNGGATSDIIFTGGGAGANFPFVTGGVRDFTVNRPAASLTLAATGALTIGRNLTITAGTFSNGTALITGPGTGSGTFAMNSGSTAAFTTTNTSANPFPVFQTYDFHTTASTVNYTGANAIAQNIYDAPQYGNLTMANGTVAKNASGNILVKGNLTLTSGTFNDAGYTVTVNGNISGATHQTTVAGGKVLLSGSSIGHTVSGTWGNLELDDVLGATSTGATTVNGNFTTTTGAFATAGQTFTVNGITTIGSGTTLSHTSGTKSFNNDLNISSTATFTTTGGTFSVLGNVTNNGTWTSGTAGFTLAGNFTNNNIFTSGTGTYTFSGASKTINGTNTITTMSVSNATGLTNTGYLTVQTLGGAGKFTNGTNATLELGFTASGPVLTTTTLDFFTNTPNTVIYSSNNATAQNVRNTTYYNLTINKASTQTANAAGSITVNNNFNIQSGIFSDNAAANVITGNGTGTFTMAAGTTYTTFRIASPWLPSGYPLANMSISPASTINYSGAAHSIVLAINGTATLPSFPHLAITTAVTKTAGEPISANNVTINTSATLSDGGFNVTVLGNLSSNGTHTSTGSGKILMGGSSAQQITTTAAAIRQFGNVEIDNAAGVSLGGGLSTFVYQINGTLTLTNGNLNVGSTTLQFNGNPLAGTPTLLSTTSLSNLVFMGTGVGHFIPSSVSDLQHLTLNNINGLSLNSDVTLSSAGIFTLTSGKLTLGAFDLTIMNTLTGAITTSANGITKMVQADGTGELRRNVGAGAISYLFPVGDNSGGVTVSNNAGADYSPVTLAFTANSTARIIGVRVVDDKHPADATANDYISRYWKFTDSQAGVGTYTYTGTYTYSTTVPSDVVGTHANVKLNGWDTAGMFWTQYTTTGTAPSLVMTGYTETSGPIGDSEFTGRVNSAQTYTWLPTSGSNLWTDPNNWSPNRFSAQPTDILMFTSGGTSTATGVVTQTVARIIVGDGGSGNTDITLTSSTGTQVITITNVTGVNTNLDIQSGSTLRLSSTAAIATQIAFTTTAGTNNATIAGTLILDNNTSGNNTYTATNSVTTVTGTITNNGGTITSTAANLFFGAGATYNHARNGGVIPVATWNVTSLCNVTGITTTNPTTFVAAVTNPFGNLRWNCTGGQTVTGQLTAASFINGNLEVLAGTLSDGGVLFSGPGTGTGKTFTINNGATFTMTNGTTTTGTLQAGSFPLFATYSFGPTSTVNYNGNATQPIQTGITYGHLRNTSGTKTPNGNLSVNGDLTIASGTVSDGGNIITVLGNLSSNGTHSSTGSGKILMGGSSAQQITTTAAAIRQFGNVEIDNAAGVSLGGGLSTFVYQINGTLTLTNGSLNVGSTTLQFNGNPLAGTPTLLSTTSLSNLVFMGTGIGHFIPSSVSDLQHLTLNNINGLSLNSDVTLSSAGIFTLTSGKLTLGAFDLTIMNTLTGAITTSANGITKMVQADGTGELRRNVGTGAISYLFPVGDNSGGVTVSNNAGADYSPVTLAFTANSTARIIGVRVVDDKHPADATANDYISRYWKFTDSQAGVGTYTYTGTYTYSTTVPSDVVGTHANVKLNGWDTAGMFWTQYTTTGTAPSLVMTGYTETSGPIGDSEFTGRVNSAQTYTWLPTSGSNLWTDPNNWSPNRFSAQPTDILMFTSGGTSTATGVVTQTVARIIVGDGGSGNTDITLTSSTGTQVITITNVTGVNTNLDIQSGSTLRLSSTAAIATQIAFTTTAGTNNATIAGTLILDNNTSGNNNYTATNSITTVTGTITNNGGTVTSTAANLFFGAGATYNHARNGGVIPVATWNVTSLCNVTGITTTNPTTFVAAVTNPFGNLRWNCTGGQTVTGQLTAASFINGNLEVLAGTLSDGGNLLSGPGTGTGKSFTISNGATFTMTNGTTTTGTLQAGSFPLFATYSFGPTSTVNYNGNATQPIQTGITYGHLRNTNGTKTPNGNLAVNGDLTIASGTVSDGGNIITLLGNLSSNGTHTSVGSGKILMDGSSAQLITTTAAATRQFGNIEIDNAAGVTLGGALSTFIYQINNTLTLTTGNLNVANATLLLNGNPIAGTPTLLTTTAASTLNYAGAVAGHSIPSSVSDLLSLTLNNVNGLSLNNDLTLASTGFLTLTNGRLTLGAFDLTVLNTLTGAISIASPSITKMVQADGAGELRRAVAAGAISYLFPVGDNSGGVTVSNNTGADYSPVTLAFTANSTARIIGVRVVDDKHPSDATANDYISRYWKFTDSQAGVGTYTYTGTYTYSTTVPSDLVGTYANVRLNRWDTGGLFWTQFNTTGSAPSPVVTGATEISGELHEAEYTARVNGSTTYTWVPVSGSNSFAGVFNWSPPRYSAQTTDVLQFTNGGTVSVTNFTAQTIARLIVGGNTDVSLTTVAGSAQALTITNTAGTNFEIQNGSTLRLNSTLANATQIVFTGTNAALIDGTLVLDANTSGNNNYVATNSTTVVNGAITNNGSAITSTALNLTFGAGSFYNHARNGGAIPLATWNVTSTCNITGIVNTNLTTFSAPVATPFGNLTWNCSAQTGTGGFTTASFINGNLQVLSGTLYDGGFLVSGPGTATGKTFTINNGASFTMTATTTTTGTLQAGSFPLFGAYAFGATSNVNYNGNGVQPVQGGITYGNLASNANAKTANSALTVAGNLTMAGTSFSNGGFAIDVRGNVVNNATSGHIGAGKIRLTAGSAPHTLSGTTGTYTNLELDDAQGASLSGVTSVSGMLSLTSGTLSLNAATLTVSGTINSTAGLLSGSSSNLTLSGTAGGNMGSIGFAAGGRTLNLLTMNRTGVSPSVTIATPLAVTTLSLTSGVINNSSTLTVTGTGVANIIGGSTASYVAGRLARNLPAIASAATYAFPVGKSDYNLFELVNPTSVAASTVEVEAFDGTPSGAGLGFAIIGLGNSYWESDVTSGSLTAVDKIELTRLAPALVSSNVVAYSATLSGTYNTLEGTVLSTTSIETAHPVSAALGFFAIADKSCSPSTPLNYTGSVTLTNDVLLGGTLNFTGDFTVNSGVTVKVLQGCPLTITATNITIDGIIDANGSGTRGGAGGARGTSFADCGQESDQSHSGGRAFGGGASSGAGGGSAGGDGVNANGKARECGGFLCNGNDNGHYGGGGGGGAGSGGSYGGAGGAGAAGAAGYYYNNGNNGTQGTGGTGGAAGGAQGTATGLDVSMGFGGGGAGGGGGSKNNGTAGAAGGNGGGMVSLVASNNLTFAGTIEADGLIGGDGGDGSTASDNQYDCSIGDCGSCGVCSNETYSGTGGAGGGGGGGSGGGILLQAFGNMNVTGSLSANGGNGGTAGFPWRTTHGSCGSRGQAMGGAAGGGGRIKIISNPCATNNISPSAFTVLGGTGGAGDVTGGAGGTGSYAPSIVHPSYTPLVAGNVLSSDYILCSGDVVSTGIDADASTGGINTYNYQWYVTKTDCSNPATGSAASPNAGWLGIVGATGEDLPAATVTQGMNDLGGGVGNFCFQRRTQSGTCYGWTGKLQISVVLPGIPSAQPATGVTQTGFTANWNSVPNATSYEIDVATNSGFTTFVAGYNDLNVGNVLNQTLTGLTLGTDYWYRVRSRIGNCESANSAVIQVTTLPVTVWTANAVNVVDKDDWFVATNWSSNQVPSATTEILIPTVPAGGNYFPIVDGLQVAEVGVITIQTGAGVTFSNGAVLEVNGNFNNSGNGTFNTGELHMLGVGSTLNGTFNVGILGIYNNTTITPSSQVNVYEVVELESGILTTNNKLTLKSSATQTGYIDDFDGSGVTLPGTGITGSVTMERYIPPTAGPNVFHYIGSVTSAPAGSKWSDDFSMNVTGTVGFVTPNNCNPLTPSLAASSNYGGLFTYHESNVTNCYLSGWRVESILYPLTPGEGVAARISNGVVLDESGAYQAADVTISNLTKTAGNAVTYSQGYSLVSNPFYAPIDWSEVAADNLGTWDGAAYVYNPSSGTYSAFNFLTSLLTISTNQAFFVRASNATAPSTSLAFTFNADTRTRISNAVFYRQRQPFAYGLNIEVEANNGKKDQALVAFDAMFNEAFDNGYDAMKLYNDAGIPSIYTKSGGDQQAIQALPLISSDTRSVPLSVFVNTSGIHTFTFNGIEDFPQTTIVWLEDLKTGTIQYLRQNNVYAFTATVGDDKDRFVLHFSPEMIVSTTIADCAGDHGAITLNQNGGIEWAFRLKDANGGVVMSDVFDSTELVNQLAPGTYTLNLTHPLSGYATTLTVVVAGLEPVEAAIVASSTEVPEGAKVTFEALTTGAVNHRWDMGDGNMYINLPVISHSYSAEGTYEVALFASNDGCNAVAKQVIVVNKQEDVSTGIVDVENGTIKVYGSGNQVFIIQKLDKHNLDATVEVYNNLGQVVYANNNAVLMYNTPDVATLQVPPGIYFTKVITKEREVVVKVRLGE